MSRTELVRIAIAGHTNTGKTTLIRTLLKSPVGKVENRANVTGVASDYKFREFEGLQAIFVDTPGFQNAGELSLLLSIRAREPDYPLPDGVKEQDFLFDQRAFNAIKSTDAVIYVATLEIVPDKSHDREIALIKSAQPRIIGLLNKRRAASMLLKKNKRELDSVIMQWQKSLKQQGIEDVIDFDAHWDKPTKILSIYNAIERVLDESKAATFRTGVARFEERQNQIKSLACQKIAECVTLCYQTRETEAKESDHTGDHRGTTEQITKNAVHEESVGKLANALSKFTKDVTEIFSIAAKSPTLSAQAIEAEHYRVKDNMGLLIAVAKAASAVSSGGAAVGGAVGALLAGLLSGGLGTLAGGALGAKIGALIGGAIGATGATISGVADTHRVVLTEASLHEIENICIATVWAMSHHGFGLTPEIEESQIHELQSEVQRINKKPFEIDEFGALVKKYEKLIDKIYALDS